MRAPLLQQQKMLRILVLLVIFLLSVHRVRSMRKCLQVISICSSLGFSQIQPSFAASGAPKLGECTTETNPSATVISCRRLGLVGGSLQGCQSQENCFSSSAKAAAKYSSPWRYDFESKTSDEAFAKLSNAVEKEGLRILKSDALTHYLLGASLIILRPKHKYFNTFMSHIYPSQTHLCLTFLSQIIQLTAAEKNVPKQPTGASLFYEFLLRDNGEEKLVLYRGVVDKTVLLYPLQQPVSDFNALNNRLDGILKRLQWLKLRGDGS